MRINKTKYSTGTIVRWLWSHHKGCRVQAVMNALIGLALVGFGLLAVDTVRRVTDIATGAREGSIGWMAALLGTVFLIEMLLHILSTWIAAVLGVRTQNLMQQAFFKRLLKGQWSGVEKYHSGDVLNRLFSDVGDIVGLMTEVIPSTLIVVVQFVASFVYLYVMDSTLALILVAVSPVFIVLSRIYFTRMRRIVRHVKDSNSAIQSIIQESVQHKMVIKTLERTETMVDRLERRQGLLRKQIKTRARFSILSKSFVNIGFAGAYLIALMWGLFQLQDGLITVGVLIAFTQLVNRIQRPLLDMARLLPMFVSSFTSAERLMELEELPMEQEEEPLALPGAVGLRFEHVDFSYKPQAGRSGRTVIHDFSHDFRPGSFTAILGETGAGKTTLIRMILALIEPTAGKATIYNTPVASSGEVAGEYRLSPAVRNNFSYIPQGNTLFSGSIRENLLLGNPLATEEQMQEALRLSKADFVFNLPQGLETKCSEQGGGLSEGQAQRIAIARALLRPCKVLLLDEATSALDMQTEQELLQNLKARFADSTIIFVTHRLAVTDFTTDTITLTRNA
jgi:ABC-type multidrug transport system fused ATPase/permease subunit